MLIARSTDENGAQFDGGLVEDIENEFVSEMKVLKGHTKLSENEPIACKADVGDIASHSPLVQLSPKLRTGLHALVSLLLPIASAIYGPVAVSKEVLGMHTLLIIDNAEDLQRSELEFLQQVFCHTSGATSTIILMTDPYGYKRVTETWEGMRLCKLDLIGLGRADIVAEAEVYFDAIRTENSLKLKHPSSRFETCLGINEQTFELENTNTNTEEDYLQHVKKISEISNENEENSECSSLHTEEAKGKENETKSGLIDKNREKSSETIFPIKDQENNDKGSSGSKDSEDMKNSVTFLDLMTGKKSIRKKNVDQKACYRPKGIGDFLSRNMCRLEKVLRFPEILVRTCDMFMDSLDMFDEITTATDLLWTLLHWEGAKAVSLSDSNEESLISFSNDKECLQQGASCSSTSKSSLDSKSFEHTFDSSKSLKNCLEPCKEFPVSARKNIRDMDKTFHEKMYSWLLLIGEKSLTAFVNNDSMGSDDFEKLKTQTIEIFGDKVAEIMINSIFKCSDFFEFSSIPENVKEFVAEHLCTDCHSDTALKPDSPYHVSRDDGHFVSLSMDNTSPPDSCMNEKSPSPKSIDTATRFSKESDVPVITAENSEYAHEQNTDPAQNLVQPTDPQQRTELDTLEHIQRHSFNENFAGRSSSDDCAHVKRNNGDLEISQPECLLPNENVSGNDTCSSDFWGEILGNENVSYLGSVDKVEEPDKFPNLKTTSPILERDLALTGNADYAIMDLTESKQLPTGSKPPLVTENVPNCLVENLDETTFNRLPLETLNETQGNEGVGNNLEDKNASEQQSTTEQLCEKEKKLDICENQIIENGLPDEKWGISKHIPLKDEETETNENFDNSPDVLWNKILRSNSDELKFEEHAFLQGNSTDKIFLRNDDDYSEQVKVLKYEKDSEEDLTDEKVAFVSITENINNGDILQGSKNNKLEEENIQAINADINCLAKPLQDHKIHHENEEHCPGTLKTHTSEIFSSGCGKFSDFCINAQRKQRQNSSDEYSEEISSLVVGGMTDDCLEENLSEKSSPTRSVQENIKKDTNCEKLINGQPVQDELRDDNDSSKNTNDEKDIFDNEFTEQLMTTNISIHEQAFCYRGDQEKQEIHENNETREKQQTGYIDLPVSEETAAVLQHCPINDLVDSTLEVEKGQQASNPEWTVAEKQETTSSSSEDECKYKMQHMQQRIDKILQVLADQTAPPLAPTLSTRNSVITQFLASWFLVHEIQSGRSLASLTYGARCCLRQLCIFSSGLVNRIRRLVGYNSELNRRRVVCALLNYRFDSSDDLLFNMDMVAEFKAYPELVSFTVEASEYPDEWHVSLYEAQLVPLQALLLNVAPSRIFLNVEEARPFSEAKGILEFLPRVEILVWLDSGRQFAYGNTDKMDEIAESFTANVVLAKVELVAGCLTHAALIDLPSHAPFKSLVYLKLRVIDMCSLSSLLSVDRQLKALLWLEVKLDFDWLSEEESKINSLPRSSVPLFDVYLRDCGDEHVVHISNLLVHLHLRYSGIHLESTSLTPEGVYVLLKQLQQKEIRLYSHPTARQRFRRWYYPQLADGPAPTDDLARERLGFDDRVFYSNHRIESNTYATAIDAWNLTSFLEEEDRIVHFVYTTENLNFMKSLTGSVEVEKISK
ncbi:uncharacterized protein LOC126999227 isoform X2 [Eriocheir sinensis]|nr:uncharacterized protein LOC126999227 isoform X2 [Eriocheir sinensis]XP_050717527.1 uncharacterized protein LOC126999227 isoform X2 [Eriocheir sinensis]